MDSLIESVNETYISYKMGSRSSGILCLVDDTVPMSEHKDELQRQLYKFNATAHKFGRRRQWEIISIEWTQEELWNGQKHTKSDTKRPPGRRQKKAGQQLHISWNEQEEEEEAKCLYIELLPVVSVDVTVAKQNRNGSGTMNHLQNSKTMDRNL